MHDQSVRRLRVEKYAWPLLGACVVAIDVYLVRQELRSLSTQFSDGCRSPWRWALVGGWGYLSLHLLDVWPDEIDPLSRLAVLLAKRGEPCGDISRGFRGVASATTYEQAVARDDP